jgi:hypothetical protein
VALGTGGGQQSDERDLNKTMNKTMDKARNQKVSRKMETLCRRCRFHPASARIAGYCSWDCYEADEEGEDAEGEGEGEKAA